MKSGLVFTALTCVLTFSSWVSSSLKNVTRKLVQNNVPKTPRWERSSWVYLRMGLALQNTTSPKMQQISKVMSHKPCLDCQSQSNFYAYPVMWCLHFFHCAEETDKRTSCWPLFLLLLHYLISQQWNSFLSHVLRHLQKTPT